MQPRTRPVGDSCLVCGRGCLAVVLKDLEQVKAGHVIKADIPIERLACDRCGVSFEAADRGKTVREVRERGLDDLESSADIPDACAHCKHDAFERGIHRGTLASQDVAYRYCLRCLRPAWIERPANRREPDAKKKREKEYVIPVTNARAYA